MSSIIIELKDKEMTDLGVEAIIDFYRTMAIDQLHLPGLSAFATGVDSSSLNVVIDTRKNEGFSLEAVNLIGDFFKCHQVPWGWFITAVSEAGEIEKYGFTLGYKMPGMYFDLSNQLPEIIADVEIREQKDDLHEWIEPLREGFPSGDNCDGYRKLNADLLRNGEEKLRHFTAYRNNEAASSATLFLSDHSVMFHNVATKNKFRRSGIGSVLMLHMMNEAKKSGFKHGFLDSSDEGFNLYSKLGFKIYCVTAKYEKN